MVPLLIGTDGERKMSKSLDNYIGLADNADDMFGKIMSIPDTLMEQYFILLTHRAIPHELAPRDAKLLLATTITDTYHGSGAGERAQEKFIAHFAEKKLPTNIPELTLPTTNISLLDLLLIAGITSKTEAKRLILQGGVKINNIKYTDLTAQPDIQDGSILQIGKLTAFTLRMQK